MAHHPDTHHDAHHHDHAHHGAAPGGEKRDAFRVGAFLLMIFLGSMAAHYLFAREMLYDWSQNRQNAAAAQGIQPGRGNGATH